MLAEHLARTVLCAVIHVPGDAPDPQAGVNMARQGDTVLLAEGIHRGPVDMGGKAITLAGAHVETSVLLGDGSSSVICFLSGESHNTVVRNLTIAGGGGTLSPSGIRRGGGMIMEHASPTIEHCLVVGNTAQVGAAIWMDGGAPVLSDCWFHGNESDLPNAAAITCNEANPRLLQCGFHGEGIGWWDAPVISVRSDCDAPGGACCLGTFCVQTTSQACGEGGGFWHKDASCDSGVCPQACPEDVNNDRRVNLTDVLRVLDAWGLCF